MSSASFRNLVENLPHMVPPDSDPHGGGVKTNSLESFLLAAHDFQDTTLAALTDLNGKVAGADPSHVDSLRLMSDALSMETGNALLSGLFSDDSGDPPGPKTRRQQ